MPESRQLAACAATGGTCPENGFANAAVRHGPKAKLSLDGFNAAELGAKVGVSARTARFYTAQHLLPAPEFRGAATRYVHAHLLHLA